MPGDSPPPVAPVTPERGCRIGWMRARRRALIIYWLVQGVMVYIITATAFLGWAGESWLGSLAALLGVLVLTGLQGVLLLPIRRPREAGGKGVPAWVMLTVVGLVVSFLPAAFLLAVVHLFESYGVLWPFGEPSVWITLGGVVLATWMVTTPLLIRFSRRQRPETFLARLSARIFTGTIIEAAAIIPMDVLLRRREDCACATGTLWAMAICGTVGMFALGPAIFVPVFARRRRRWYMGKCENCGYDIRATPRAERCPECGMGWRRAQGEGVAE